MVYYFSQAEFQELLRTLKPHEILDVKESRDYIDFTLLGSVRTFRVIKP